MELEDNLPLLEWLANNYKTFGAQLEIITDRLGWIGIKHYTGRRDFGMKLWYKQCLGSN